ncbi:Uncharacterised protein [Klebsiella quasipneumoniae]|nr:Uncharacterised protein [Klebsiella quasipneumoniae]
MDFNSWLNLRSYLRMQIAYYCDHISCGWLAKSALNASLTNQFILVSDFSTCLFSFGRKHQHQGVNTVDIDRMGAFRESLKNPDVFQTAQYRIDVSF